MEVIRKTAIDTNEFQIGDQIKVKHYTATCQAVTEAGALFLLDQYLDEPYRMNRKPTNEGGYEASDLREKLQSEEVLAIFADFELLPHENGDLLRLPFAGEIFGEEVPIDYEPDCCEQWPLMKDRKNRVAFRRNGWEWGWLQNIDVSSSTSFANVVNIGYATYNAASGAFGVRPAFLIR